ncbi:hypothetical protein AMAG_07280 [Allomyces macrogynus ATCC 38327]|uniref:25S rRNA adenine-N(1) methyltransferase n=1 Tax=Allomyces macrogynus (strain ATCC 38327) TaxID=578462 RepID=A0A0L0SHV1_ALLM3|nr:hypothetical protein AMAG_07280 [Allomyces macrogynus ATCC 38327]|eukprot:KNE62022.1 hypothetical protein AMAG_07280 [Allomyces macrogynus ATCC 38327]
MAKSKKKTPIVRRVARSTTAALAVSTPSHIAPTVVSSEDAAGSLPTLPRKKRARKAITRFHAAAKQAVTARHDDSDSDEASDDDDAGASAAKRARTATPADAFSAVDLAAYQRASMKIQSTKYPSELLVALMAHLADAQPPIPAPGGLPDLQIPRAQVPLPARPLSLLDVGALEGPVAYRKVQSRGLLGDILSIDLNPQSPAVLRADFFQFPTAPCRSTSPRKWKDEFDFSEYLAPVADTAQVDPACFPGTGVPTTARQTFDVVSLSLVVNFLPTPAARGAMLAKAIRHLAPNGARLVYLVLPRACVANARYMDAKRLHGEVMMKGLGARLVAERESAKLVCALYQVDKARAGCPCGCGACAKCSGVEDEKLGEEAKCRCGVIRHRVRGKVGKAMVNDGKKRNNFSIIL